MSTLTIVAVIQAKQGAEAQVYEELVKLIEPSQSDAGCINYDLHRSIEDPAIFVFHENWESKALWEQHMQAEHLQRHQEATDGLIENVTLYQLEAI